MIILILYVIRLNKFYHHHHHESRLLWKSVDDDNELDIIGFYFDHGSRPFIFKIMATRFFGKEKRDGDISRDVSWIRNHLQKTKYCNYYCTEDLELRQRRKRAVASIRLSKKKDRSSIEQRFICHLIYLKILRATKKSSSVIFS